MLGCYHVFLLVPIPTCHYFVIHHIFLTTSPSWFSLSFSFCCYSPRSSFVFLCPCHSIVTHNVLLLVPSFLVFLLLLITFPSWFPLSLSFCCYSPRSPLGSSLLVILLLLTTFSSWFSLFLSICCYSPHSPLGFLFLLLLTTLPCLSSFSLPSCCSCWSRLPCPPRRAGISPQSLTPTKSRRSSWSLCTRSAHSSRWTYNSCTRFIYEQLAFRISTRYSLKIVDQIVFFLIYQVLH